MSSNACREQTASFAVSIVPSSFPPQAHKSTARLRTVPYEGGNFANYKKTVTLRKNGQTLIDLYKNFLKTDWNFFLCQCYKQWEVYLKVKKLFKAKTTMFLKKHRPSAKSPPRPYF